MHTIGKVYSYLYCHKKGNENNKKKEAIEHECSSVQVQIYESPGYQEFPFGSSKDPLQLTTYSTYPLVSKKIQTLAQDAFLPTFLLTRRCLHIKRIHYNITDSEEEGGILNKINVKSMFSFRLPRVRALYMHEWLLYFSIASPSTSENKLGRGSMSEYSCHSKLGVLYLKKKYISFCLQY